MDEVITQKANEARFLFEVWLNVQIATSTYYRYGWNITPLVGDIEEIHNKYMALGVIK
jgi:hypothetical protein